MSLVRSLSRFSKKEIDFAFKNARRILYHPGVDLLIAPRQYEYGRILIMVPRAVGPAPKRNTIKRQFKALFYENTLYKYPYDLIVIAKKKAAHCLFADFKKLLLDAYRPLPDRLATA